MNHPGEGVGFRDRRRWRGLQTHGPPEAPSLPRAGVPDQVRVSDERLTSACPPAGARWVLIGGHSSAYTPGVPRSLVKPSRWPCFALCPLSPPLLPLTHLSPTPTPAFALAAPHWFSVCSRHVPWSPPPRFCHLSPSPCITLTVLSKLTAPPPTCAAWLPLKIATRPSNTRRTIT